MYCNMQSSRREIAAVNPRPRVDLEFAGGRKEQFGVGDSVMIPGGLPHQEIATSDDLELR